MKKVICVLLMTVVLASGIYVWNNWTKITAKNGIWVDWNEPWFLGDEVLYYGEVYNSGETITRWLKKSAWEIMIEARGKGLMVSPL